MPSRSVSVGAVVDWSVAKAVPVERSEFERIGNDAALHGGGAVHAELGDFIAQRAGADFHAGGTGLGEDFFVRGLSRVQGDRGADDGAAGDAIDRLRPCGGDLVILTMN